MSERRVELFLFDIYVAILKIEKTVEKFENSEELLHDFNAWDSVIREFEIMGEAARHLIESSFALRFVIAKPCGNRVVAISK